MKKFDKILLGFGWTIVILYFILAAGKAHGSAEEETMDRYCMAQNIYFESANQSFAGRLAVANVVMNRVDDLQFPNKVCDVIYQAKTKINWKGNEVPIRNQCQFSWYCDGLSDEPVDSATWIKSLYIADLVLTGVYKDITEGSLWYHADYIYPYWADELEYVTQIEDHIFYK
jgi:spore germination cell wall hydrolase CwlJ-like protein